MAARAADDGTGITSAALIESVAELREVIERAAEIRRGLFEARSGLGRVDDAYEVLRSEALTALAGLEARAGT